MTKPAGGVSGLMRGRVETMAELPVIFAVDDEPMTLGAVTRDLQSRYEDRFRILRAESGAVALETLRELRLRNMLVALLIVDQRMPEMTGVEILTAEVTGVRTDGQYRIVQLADGSELSCHALLITAGVAYRRLDAPGVDRVTGAGIYYGGALSEAVALKGEDIFIVGGANSAGQAAIHFAGFARSVTILVRGDSLQEGMSQYLVDRIDETKNIHVWMNAGVVEAIGDGHLEALRICDTQTGCEQTVPAAALFVFIGAKPYTGWLSGLVGVDGGGYVLTGSDVTQHHNGVAKWPLQRDPFLLETNVPGVFVAGDIRRHSMKRIVSATGEGAMAIHFVHQYLSTLYRKAEKRSGLVLPPSRSSITYPSCLSQIQRQVDNQYAFGRTSRQMAVLPVSLWRRRWRLLMLTLKRKAFAYITHGNRLLVFRHPNAPDAGIQVPAGTMKDGERPVDAVMREAYEETGLAGLELVRFLGEQVHDTTDFGGDEVHHRYFYHLRYTGDPPMTWRHYESDPDTDEPELPLFEFFWATIPHGVPPLIADHGALLPRLIRQLQEIAGTGICA